MKSIFPMGSYSTTLVTNQSGGIIEEEFYLPFGDVYSGSESSRFLFTNKELDKLTDLYYYGARFYQASIIRRFIQPDSIIADIYNPQALNRYSYVLNNPYKYVDESGHFAFAPIAIAGGIGAVVGVGSYLINIAITGEQFNVGALAAYTAGGAVGAAVGTAVTLAGGGLFALSFAGGISSVGSQSLTNLATERPLGEGLFTAGTFGAISGGVASNFPLARTWLIKNPSSYFTTKTGQTFITNILAEEGLSSSLNIFTDAAIANYNSNQQYGCSSYQTCANQPANQNTQNDKSSESGGKPSNYGQAIKGGGICGKTTSCPT